MIKIATTKDLKKLAGNDPFLVEYRKKNGRFRSAVAQFGVTEDSNGNQLVSSKLDPEQAAFENETGVVRYFDHDADGYRQFTLDRIIILEVGGQRYDFGK